MAVTSNTLIPDRYTGNGSRTDFPYTFLIQASGDLVIYFDGVIQAAGFSVSDVGNANGGEVTFTSAPANGVSIVFTRSTAADQQTDLTADDAFPAEAIETRLDQMALMAQEARESLTRAILFNINTGRSDVALPDLEAEKFLKVSAAGNSLEWSTDAGITSPTEYTAPVSGAVARTVSSRLSDRISIRDFDMDDGEDITSKLNTLLGVFASSDPSDSSIDSGIIIDIPPGVFTISDTISFPKNARGIILRGAGIDATRLRPTSGLTGKPAILFMNQVRCGLRDLWIEDPASGTATAGVESRVVDSPVGEGTTNGHIKSVRVGEVGGGGYTDGLLFDADPGFDQNNDRWYVEDSEFTGINAGLKYNHSQSVIHAFINCSFRGDIGVQTSGGSAKFYNVTTSGTTWQFDLDNPDAQVGQFDVFGGFSETSAGKLVRIASGPRPMLVRISGFHLVNGSPPSGTSRNIVEMTDGRIDFTMEFCQLQGGASNTFKLSPDNSISRFYGNWINVQTPTVDYSHTWITKGNQWQDFPIEVTGGNSRKIQWGDSEPIINQAGSETHQTEIRNETVNVAAGVIADRSVDGLINVQQLGIINQNLSSWPGTPTSDNRMRQIVNAAGWVVQDNNAASRIQVGLGSDFQFRFFGGNAVSSDLKYNQTSVSSATGTTLTASNLIPAGSLVLGVTIRVTTGFGTSNGLTSIDIGDGTDVDRWGASIGITGGTTTTISDFTGTSGSFSPAYFTSANDVVITGNGDGGDEFDGTGAIRVTVHYINLTAAGS